MLREVTLNFQGEERTYKVDADSHYLARIEALSKFLEELKLPGRPLDYLTKKKGLIDIAVKSSVDRRTQLKDRVQADGNYILDQVVKLRALVRSSTLTNSRKAKAVDLLLKLEEVVS